MFRFTVGKVKGRHQILVTYAGYLDRMPEEWCDARHVSCGGRAVGTTRHGLIGHQRRV